MSKYSIEEINQLQVQELIDSMQSQNLKRCCRCGIDKEISEFIIAGKIKSRCFSCESERKKVWYKKNKERMSIKNKQYYIDNKQKINNKTKQYYLNNKEAVQKQTKQYRELNRDKIAACKEKYKNNNQAVIKESNKNYYAKKKDDTNFIQKRKAYRIINRHNKYLQHRMRMKEDVSYRISCLLRNRLNVAVKRCSKVGSAVKDLGCSIEWFKEYMEQQFYDNTNTNKKMSWENYGEWHIDHIMPLASFDLTNRDQFLKAVHYTNLQPLWAKDNLSKGAKIIQ